LRNCRGALRRLDDSIGYKDWKYQEVKKRLEELEPYRRDKPEGEDGWRPTQYKRLEIEMRALHREKEKHDRSGKDLDLSRRQWAKTRSGWSALRNRVSSEVEKGVSKLGEYVKKALGDGRGSVLPVGSPHAVPLVTSRPIVSFG